MSHRLQSVAPDYVRELIDFAGRGGQMSRVAQLQLDGTVAAFNMLAMNRCAYVADEVGMGKTMIALGVMGLLRLQQPTARVIIIVPRENLQQKWEKELRVFVGQHWKPYAGVKSLQGMPSREPVRCSSLLHFVHESLLNPDRDFLLRMTSFSIRTREPVEREKLRRELKKDLRWVEEAGLSARDPLEFRDAFGCAINAAIPNADLVIVDEGHNLKHGFDRKGSTRNRVLGMAFGHPEGQQQSRPWYGSRAQRVLFLSATPFEADYADLYSQLAVLGFGEAELRNADGLDPKTLGVLTRKDLPESERREIVSRFMIRRVSALRLNGNDQTRNMYRREWRAGGLAEHDKLMRIDKPRHRLVVALMQKKVSEVLQRVSFNNHFQIGMLSSFESYLESVATTARGKSAVSAAGEAVAGVFDDEEQNRRASDNEKEGIDTNVISRVGRTYREWFNEPLPHPKLDATVEAIDGPMWQGEKTLVFVRRKATVHELAEKLNRAFDKRLITHMESGLEGDLRGEIRKLFDRYQRARRQEETANSGRAVRFAADEKAADPSSGSPTAESAGGDEGSTETFFSWFFRGDGPPKVLSGAAFKKNRLDSRSASEATLFEDNHLGWLLGYPPDGLTALAAAVGSSVAVTAQELRDLAWSRFRGRGSRQERYPRLFVYEAYQGAGLKILERGNARIAKKARVVVEESYRVDVGSVGGTAPDGFPGPEDVLGARTFFTGLAGRQELRGQIWPEVSEDDFRDDFRSAYRRRELQRLLIKSMARLGVAYIDFYLEAMRGRSTFDLGRSRDDDLPTEELSVRFLNMLEKQMRGDSGFAYKELAAAARDFSLILETNFPKITPGVPLDNVLGAYADILTSQVPVGRMEGRVNKTLVSQFRMPGFPFVLVTTDVLQEGEDLHTYCRRVVHYGITWTPSAMEQRTGRIDRINSLFQRRWDNKGTGPTPDDHIQVFLPYLQDTVEVLQVRRVLKRLNKFLSLLHDIDGQETRESRLDVGSDINEELVPVAPYRELLKSAFPVREDWRAGTGAVMALPAQEYLLERIHFEEVWKQLCKEMSLEDTSLGDIPLRRRAKTCQDSGPIEFGFSLRSRISGGGLLLRCETDPVLVDIDAGDYLNRLRRIQVELGNARVCALPQERKDEEKVFAVGEIFFHAPGGHLKFPHPWPGQNPPPRAATGRLHPNLGRSC